MIKLSDTIVPLQKRTSALLWPWPAGIIYKIGSIFPLFFITRYNNASYVYYLMNKVQSINFTKNFGSPCLFVPITTYGAYAVMLQNPSFYNCNLAIPKASCNFLHVLWYKSLIIWLHHIHAYIFVLMRIIFLYFTLLPYSRTSNLW